MLICAWSFAQIFIGASESRLKDVQSAHFYFWRLSIVWGIVNALIALFLLYQLYMTVDGVTTMYDLAYITQLLITVLIALSVINIFYIFIGFPIFLYSIKKNSQKLLGYSRSLMTQGTLIFLIEFILLVANVYFLYQY